MAAAFLFRNYYFNIISDKKPAFNYPGNCFQVLFQRRVNITEAGIKNKVAVFAGGKDGPVLTENGNFIFDTRFSYVDPSLEQNLKAITGVIESGLFIGYDVEIVVAK